MHTICMALLTDYKVGLMLTLVCIIFAKSMITSKGDVICIQQAWEAVFTQLWVFL